uniref:Uncharacterized protein n=1 Tax=Loxodonta africana TaxID=9785 RepID=G3U385_LOXAF
CSAPADWSPARPLQGSSDKAVIADNPKNPPPDKSTQGLPFCPHPRKEACLSTVTTMHEPQMFLGAKGWHQERCQNLSQGSGLEHHKEPGNRQHETGQQNVPPDREHLCNPGDLELPGERQQSQQKSVDLEAEMKGGSSSRYVDLPGTGKIAVSSELLVFRSTAGVNVRMLTSGILVHLISNLSLDNPFMEVEASEYNSSSEILNNSISPRDLQLPESTVDLSGTKNDGLWSNSLSLYGSCQSFVESIEESCSVTAPLKELHEHVVSSEPASENASEEAICQSEMVAEGQTAIQELSGKMDPKSYRCSEPALMGPICVVKTEKLISTSPGAGGEELENVSVRGPGDSVSTDGKRSLSQGVKENSATILTSAEAFTQLYYLNLRCRNITQLLADENTSVRRTEATESLDLPQRAWTQRNICSEATRPLLEFGSSPFNLPPLVFPYSRHEALGALHPVGRNANLALLVLLAKNILVPT